MKFYMPVRVFEEEDCVRAHAADIAAFGRKALIVTGGHSSRANGSLADVQEALASQGASYAVFDGVEENPSVETVMAAREFGLQEGADFVIGLGGGSPLDAAKAIALMLRHPEADRDHMLTAGTDSAALPLVLIPTTCGTGSEVTQFSILTFHEKKTKGSIPHVLFGDLALIDGRYLQTAPLSVLRNTAVDALAHLWESALNSTATPYSRMCVDAGLEAWSRIRPVLTGERQAQAEDYAGMMRASMFAGMAIAQTGTALPHGLSYPLTYDLGMAHGKAVGYFQAGYLARVAREDEALAADALHRAGFADLTAWQDFYQMVCAPEYVEDAQLEHCCRMLEENPAKLKNACFEASGADLREIAFYGR